MINQKESKQEMLYWSESVKTYVRTRSLGDESVRKKEKKRYRQKTHTSGDREPSSIINGLLTFALAISRGVMGRRGEGEEERDRQKIVKSKLCF